MGGPRGAPAPLAAALSVFRPLQYLGSKLRSLDAIAEAAVGLVGEGGAVLDPFCGSSVVAQGLADAGLVVHASDALAFCASAARAALGVGRGDRGVSAVVALAEVPTPRWGLDSWVEREAAALDAGDGMELLAVSREVPQVWRGEGAPDPGDALVASHYAGTYFGVGQALRIDALRRAIDGVGGWERDVALTALTAAMSACAYSAGKHFAQPHRLDPGKDLSFHARRALADRAVDVDAVFVEAARALASRRCTAGHTAHQAAMEDLPVSPRVDLVYADPPYTGQQYSRFYHVPEVVHAYVRPTLQRHRGSVTSGLYPERRHRSDFCSKRRAAAAFGRLAQLAAARHAELLVSYSGSRGATGNARMIGLEELVALLRTYGPVARVDLDHAYRQFNRSANTVRAHDPEVLLHCRVRPC